MALLALYVFLLCVVGGLRSAHGLTAKEIYSNGECGRRHVCPRIESTCCTRQSELKLSKLAGHSYNSTWSDKLSLLERIFQTARYDSIGVGLIDRSSQDTLQTLTASHGSFFEENAIIFTELFGKLKSYFRGERIDLSKTIDTFFSKLMQKVFLLSNDRYVFDDKYLTCLASNLGSLMPFGNVPTRTREQMEKSFIMARTFRQGLIVGRETVAAVATLKPSSSCINAVTRMLYCPTCHDRMPMNPELKPCNGFCLNVMRGCYAQLYGLNDAWNTYLAAMEKLAGRLTGPFDLEPLLGIFELSISDAMMTFMEDSSSITARMFRTCGIPKLSSGGRKRNVAAPASRGNVQLRSIGLKDLIRDLRDRLQKTRDFWKTVPDTVCDKMTAVSELNCWNGSGKSRYVADEVDSTLSSQVSNPEVAVDVQTPSPVINQRVSQLTIVTRKLMNAYYGRDDGEAELDLDLEGSGSDDEAGSGPDDDLTIRHILLNSLQ